MFRSVISHLDSRVHYYINLYGGGHFSYLEAGHSKASVNAQITEAGALPVSVNQSEK